ncbi:multidrug resistance protein MdtG [Anaerotignum neopropionicum]|uniref:Multidrug resistance protein MdtG n=1 Tax=Anaerotignum neopropionicum TaxID=36847 RepID=A0A136WCN7_9FIRM|nr:MFS transporter [Anaerotignum neopropionicum]KXL52267.1 multidrug resistance protein MdtG [Anaerotignum neopropionicum]
MKTKLFQRDFLMVVIGQIISLFGNNVLRFSLPLYLLNKTHSAMLYGTVMALSFLPMLLLSPVGGIVADRVNKRNVMVCLDFFTAVLMLFYALSFETLPLVPLLIAVLMMLYGIQGAYQPTVQSSLPVLTPPDKLMVGNAVINMVNSLAGVIGPVLGGLIFGFYGIKPILYLSIVCFFLSAVMEIFIHIPFEKRNFEGSVLSLAASDLRESWQFIRHDHPEIGRVGLLLTAVNLVFSALVIVGLPIVVTSHLGFDQAIGNRLYGYAEGALAAGGLLGGLLSGVIGNKLKVSRGARLIFWCTATLLPMGLALRLPIGSMTAYLLIVGFCVVMMTISTLLSVEMITYVQKITPVTLTAKVMALLLCLVMCGNPIGQAIYGVLFEWLSASVDWIYFGAFTICLGLCMVSHVVFRQLSDNVIAS